MESKSTEISNRIWRLQRWLALQASDLPGKSRNFLRRDELAPTKFTLGAKAAWSTTSRYERQLIRLGPSTSLSIAASMQRTAVDVCSNAICRADGKAREGVAEELTGFGIRGGMLKRMEGFVCRVAAESTRPDRTLLAISYLASATVVVVLRSVFGLSG